MEIWRYGDMEIVGIIDKNGGTISKNYITNILQQSNGDIDSLNSLLKNKYGSDFSIETFDKNEGPTVSEVHELFNGGKLSTFINNEVSSREQNYQKELHRTNEFQKQRLMYNQTPQVAVFSVEDTIVGSINEKGYLTVNRNIIEQADRQNIDREALKSFYSYDEINNTDIESVKAMLVTIFDNNVEVDQFKKSERPTLMDVKNNSKAKLLPL